MWTRLRSFSAILSAAAFIAIPLGGADNAARPSEGWVPLVSLAPVDVSAMVSEVDQTGEVTMIVAGRPLRLLLDEHDIFAPGGRSIVRVDEDFTQTVIGYVSARTFRGSVADAAPSAAVITLDGPKNALRGSIFIDERAYFLRTVVVEGQTFLETTWEEAPTPTPDVIPQHASGASDFAPLGAGNKYTFVRPVGSTQYAADPSWTTHVTDVFNQQHAMWDNQVFMHQYIGPFTVMSNYATTSCPPLLDAFEVFVQAGIDTGWAQDAYQLFAHNHLEDCTGLANTYTLYDGGLVHGTNAMTSVLEAHDHLWYDSYDPDNSYHLGLVSATELSHNYGEWEHSNACRAWDFWGSCIDYNVMAASADFDDRNFWWTTVSHDRIYHDSYHQL